MSIWEDFIDSLKDPAAKLAKDELKDLIRTYKADESEFLRKQAGKMQRYLTQLAQGEIDKNEFQHYMEDIKDLTKMERTRMAVAAKARAQKLVAGITTLILDSLVSLI